MLYGIRGYLIAGTFSLCLGSKVALAKVVKPNNYESLEIFPVDREINPHEWETFLNAKQSERHKLWQLQTSKGRRLKNWNWTWRIAWVRVCAQSSKAYCGEIMNEALVDQALVVRAEAVSRLGDRFENTGFQYENVIRAIEKAYDHPGNIRNGKPLYIKEKIINTLNRITNEPKSKRIEKLAKKHPSTFEYWKKITAG